MVCTINDYKVLRSIPYNYVKFECHNSEDYDSLIYLIASKRLELFLSKNFFTNLPSDLCNIIDRYCGTYIRKVRRSEEEVDADNKTYMRLVSDYEDGELLRFL